MAGEIKIVWKGESGELRRKIKEEQERIRAELKKDSETIEENIDKVDSTSAFIQQTITSNLGKIKENADHLNEKNIQRSNEIIKTIELQANNKIELIIQKATVEVDETENNIKNLKRDLEFEKINVNKMELVVEKLKEETIANATLIEDEVGRMVREQEKIIEVSRKKIETIDKISQIMRSNFLAETRKALEVVVLESERIITNIDIESSDKLEELEKTRDRLTLLSVEADKTLKEKIFDFKKFENDALQKIERIKEVAKREVITEREIAETERRIVLLDQETDDLVQVTRLLEGKLTGELIKLDNFRDTLNVGVYESKQIFKLINDELTDSDTKIKKKLSESQIELAKLEEKEKAIQSRIDSTEFDLNEILTKITTRIDSSENELSITASNVGLIVDQTKREIVEAEIKVEVLRANVKAVSQGIFVAARGAIDVFSLVTAATGKAAESQLATILSVSLTSIQQAIALSALAGASGNVAQASILLQTIPLFTSIISTARSIRESNQEGLIRSQDEFEINLEDY